jgi:hypothetical protein
MFGHKKDRDTKRSDSARHQSMALAAQERLQLMSAFMIDPPGGAPVWSQGTSPGYPGSGGGASGLFFGAEDGPGMRGGAAFPAGAGSSINLPGIGVVTRDQMMAAMHRMEHLMIELTGGSSLDHPPTPAELQGILQRLEAVRARGGVTEDQYRAVKMLAGRFATS